MELLSKLEPAAEAQAIEKEKHLSDLFSGYGKAAIAYSGGVDSTYLADVAHSVLEANAHLVLADSPSIPRAELAEAMQLAQERGWNLQVLHTDEFANPDFVRNDARRCYYCKTELFSKMRAYAAQHGISILVYGANTDDLQDATRVGSIAAKEQRVVAPLQGVRMTKQEIRFLSARRGLPTSDKPAFACLSSRLPKGAPVTLDALARIEQAEEALRREGFRQYRARHHGDICRIEVEAADLPRLLEPDTRQRVVDALNQAGYRYVTLDLAGYRSGSTA